MDWQFFFGACLLTGALLIPIAGVGPVVLGMILAAALRFAWLRRAMARSGEPRQ